MKTLPKEVVGRVCKGLRALLGWEQKDLSTNASIGVATVRSIEHAQRNNNASTILSIKTVFEENGITVDHDEENKEVTIKYRY